MNEHFRVKYGKERYNIIGSKRERHRDGDEAKDDEETVLVHKAKNEQVVPELAGRTRRSMGSEATVRGHRTDGECGKRCKRGRGWLWVLG